MTPGTGGMSCLAMSVGAGHLPGCAAPRHERGQGGEWVIVAVPRVGLAVELSAIQDAERYPEQQARLPCSRRPPGAELQDLLEPAVAAYPLCRPSTPLAHASSLTLGGQGTILQDLHPSR